MPTLPAFFVREKLDCEFRYVYHCNLLAEPIGSKIVKYLCETFVR